jgi:hypothetical protein
MSNRMVKLNVSVMGYPIWIEMEPRGIHNEHYAQLRAEAALYSLTEANTCYPTGVPLRLYPKHDCHEPGCIDPKAQ